jgi:hypothetical protein
MFVIPLKDDQSFMKVCFHFCNRVLSITIIIINMVHHHESPTLARMAKEFFSYAIAHR